LAQWLCWSWIPEQKPDVPTSLCPSFQKTNYSLRPVPNGYSLLNVLYTIIKGIYIDNHRLPHDIWTCITISYRPCNSLKVKHLQSRHAMNEILSIMWVFCNHIFQQRQVL
jgi:hypothetical protein